MALKPVYQKVIDSIPDYQVFLTPDELDESSRALAAEFPGTVELSEIGKTRKGRPLLCLKIGDGPKNALVFGTPHPNEPIGTMLCEHFTRCLAEDAELRAELGYTWYFVKNWDADSLELNKKWLKGPFTITNYSRNFFRPAGNRQVDWTWPIDYKTLHFHEPLPETLAMQGLIDRVKPTFIYSLHNAGFGGVYWYQSGKTPEIWPAMRQAAIDQGVPLNLGEPEAPYCELWAPAVYRELGMEQEYDYLEKYGAPGTDPADGIECGTNSGDYAFKNYGSFTFLTELPYFYDPRIDDQTPTDRIRRDVVTESLDWTLASSKFLRETLAVSRRYMDDENPFMRAIEAFTRDSSDAATRQMIAEDPDFAKPATEAQVFDNILVTKFYKLLSYGMLVRANESELQAMDERGEQDDEKRAALQKGFDLAVPAHAKLAAELEEAFHYQVVPIKKLVTIQLSCGLMMADYVREHEGAAYNNA